MSDSDVYFVVFCVTLLAVMLCVELWNYERDKQFGNKCGCDQECPHCGTWQSDCGGWLWSGNSENPEIDFVAECRKCGMYSDWVWIGPGVCATYEEINKPKRKSTPPGDE